jgi:hypothetical protein
MKSHKPNRRSAQEVQGGGNHPDEKGGKISSKKKNCVKDVVITHKDEAVHGFLQCPIQSPKLATMRSRRGRKARHHRQHLNKVLLAWGDKVSNTLTHL